MIVQAWFGVFLVKQDFILTVQAREICGQIPFPSKATIDLNSAHSYFLTNSDTSASSPTKTLFITPRQAKALQDQSLKVIGKTASSAIGASQSKV